MLHSQRLKGFRNDTPQTQILENPKKILTCNLDCGNT